MKLKNRIMSWILSPGAYAVWHAAGSPEEWELENHDRFLRHKATGILLWVGYDGLILFRGIFGAFVFDGEDRWTGINRPACIGLFERHIVYPKLMQCALSLMKARKNAERDAANRALFAKLIVNE